MTALPSIESLRCFLAAAETRNFRAAARRVALTPSAFSTRIQQLEHELGTQLFERTTRSVALTPAGHRLVARAQDVMDAALRCRSAALGDNPTPERFVVGTRFELGVSWLVPCMIELRNTHPHWTLELVFGSGAEILDKLGRSELDAVITSAPVARADWTAAALHEERYALVGSASLLAGTPFSELRHAALHTLIDIDRSLPLARYLLSVAPGLRFGGVLPAGTGAAVLRMVELDQGVAVLPRYMIDDALRSGRLVSLLPTLEPLSDTFRLIYPAATARSEALDALADALRTMPLR